MLRLPYDKEIVNQLNFVYILFLFLFLSSDWWIKFFTDSGIPSFASSEYAVIFYENRIQCNMLMDLDKNILKEIGIKVIGDRIAILKHAKKVYSEVFITIYDLTHLVQIKSILYFS